MRNLDVVLGSVALFCILLLALVGFAFADSLGVVGSLLVEEGESQGLPPEVVLGLVACLGWLITRLAQGLLKFVPTTWREDKYGMLTVNFFWKVLGLLFGKSITYYNMRGEEGRIKQELGEHMEMHN